MQGYVRHRPENTQLYQTVDKYYPDFQLSLAEQDKRLPRYVEREFDEFLCCGRLEHGPPVAGPAQHSFNWSA